MIPLKDIYVTRMLSRLEALLAIDSTTSDYEAIQAFLSEQLTALGFTPQPLHKGGLTALIGGEERPIVVSAHADDIGLMVHRVLDNGTLQMHNIGGLRAYAAEHVNVRLKTRDGRCYTGTMRRKYPSLHMMPDDAYINAGASYDDLALYLDEDVRSAADVAALGIRPGDIAALEPNLQITDSGYVKSRFLDDKAAVAILLTYLSALREEGRLPRRRLTVLFSMYEEIGHGGACGIPADAEEFLSIDVGLVGPGQQGDEKKVSVFACDSRFPYHYRATTDLVNLAEARGIPCALDIHLPRYGSDSDVALTSGHDVINTGMGPAVLGTHAYERTHIEGLKATFDLLDAYLG